MDVSDRRLHVQLTQEAKITSDFSLIRAIFAFAGFVSALKSPGFSTGRHFQRTPLGTRLAWRPTVVLSRRRSCNSAMGLRSVSQR